MYSKHLKNWIILDTDSIYKAHWQLYKGGIGILMVVGEDSKFKGVITYKDIEKSFWNDNLNVNDVCNDKCKYIIDGTRGGIYSHARDLFADFPWIRQIPIITEDRDIIDLMTRDRAFYRENYINSKLPRMHYARCMWYAVEEAKKMGYDSISVIEFGVAAGNGLINCEFHAKEISRIFGINIEVYGFDSAEGLPKQNCGYKDMIHYWQGGSYHMDRELLEERLQFARLIIGDINTTTKNFIEKYSPAPIGCVLVDVDYYSSTVPIMKLLETEDHTNFLPRIYMYFDDVSPHYQFSGETLAIREFNQRNKDIKISPEVTIFDNYEMKIKTCHRFMHEKYNFPLQDIDELPLRDIFI